MVAGDVATTEKTKEHRMRGIVAIDGHRHEIYSKVIDPFWWRHPDPVFDFTRLVLDRPENGPQPEPWRGELAEMSRILTTATHDSNRN